MNRLPFIVLLACLTTGCALTTDEVNIQYHSETATNSVPGAQNIIVQVNASEGRTSDLDKVSVKKNSYGMEMAPIISKRPLPDLVKLAIEEELRKEGFKIGSGKIYVDVELDKFYNDFKIGFFSGNAVSEVIITCQVKTMNGQIFYARTVSGDSDIGGVLLANGANAKRSLERAFSAAVARLVSDPNFTQALLNAARSSGGFVS